MSYKHQPGIQETVSGGFDAHGGTQLLAALEGLFNTVGQFVETDDGGSTSVVGRQQRINDRWVLASLALRRPHNVWLVTEDAEIDHGP